MTNRYSLLILLSLFFSFAYSQEPVEESNKIKEFNISEINSFEEQTSSIISESRKKLKRLNEENSIDISDEIDSLNNLISLYSEEYISNLSVTGLKNIKPTIESIASEVKESQDQFTKVLTNLQEIKNQIDQELEFWTNAKEQIKESNEITSSVMKRVENTLSTLKEVDGNLNSILNKVLDNTTQISQFNTSVEVLLENIEEQDNSLRSSYLVRESDPIWLLSKIAKDTTIKKTSSATQILRENTDALRIYTTNNYGNLIFHAIIILLLFLIFSYSRNISLEILSEKNQQHFIQFSNNPLSVAYVYSFFIMSFDSNQFPVFLMEILLVSLLWPIYILLETYIQKKNRLYIKLFMALFSLNLFIHYISLVYISGRIILLIFEMVVFGYFIFIIIKSRKSIKSENFGFFMSIMVISSILFFIAIISNLLGSVNLSLLLSVSTVNSIGIGILSFLFFQITRALLIVFAEVKPFSGLNIIKERKETVLKMCSAIIRFVITFLFIRALLKQFRLLVPFLDWWDTFISDSWEIGEITVSIGDFLRFFIIVFLTVYIARFIRYSLRIEILPRIVKKRGVPMAVSTSVYYILLVIGLFIAAFSTGIEWSKVNLALGALGVGIGFGLQTLVYNFIAGLILTYERPVQEGDIVQLNNLMGSIKHIGVRSSRVQTYDGAEVVVPNGNLIANEVINWTLTNNLKRQELKFKASINSNPQEIVEILRETSLKNVKVMQDPRPLSLFEGYDDDGTLNFRLLFWTHVDVGLSSKSEVALAVYQELQTRGYELPVKQSKVSINKEN